MQVTPNNDQKLFVIGTSGGYSCLGFDVVFNYVSELVARISKAGRILPVSAPMVDEIGTLKQYQDYQELMAVYRTIDDNETWFDASTPAPVRKVLERCRMNGKMVRVFHGDRVTGRDWMDEFDTVGRIGRSMGPMKVPLLVPQGENGGGALLSSCIVRIIDVDSNTELYRHPTYHCPELEIRAITDDFYMDLKGKKVILAQQGYTHSVWGRDKDGKEVQHANFKSLGRAAKYVAFMTGEIHQA